MKKSKFKFKLRVKNLTFQDTFLSTSRGYVLVPKFFLDLMYFQKGFVSFIYGISFSGVGWLIMGTFSINGVKWGKNVQFFARKTFTG